MPIRRRARGFTLIEVSVALALLALLAMLGWRALDGLVRTRDALAQSTQTWLGWQTTLAQWRTDLDAWTSGPTADDRLPTWSVSAQTVRWLRRAPTGPDAAPGWIVVAWAAVDDGQRWARWQSPPVRDLAQARVQWASAPQRVRDEGVRTVAIAGWSLHTWIDGAWRPPADDTPPVAVRLTLTPAPGGPGGPLVVDWVAASVAGGKQ
ncbi:MAG: prepilin-type N-terminal cleavage/methylation domain-containing protein [Pseudomonadota bacterium]